MTLVSRRTLSGGNFNKLRKKQTYLEQLLRDNVEGYISSNSKREFVKEKILDKIPGGLKVSVSCAVVGARLTSIDKPGLVHID